MRAKWSIYINGNNSLYNNWAPLRYKLENHFICYDMFFKELLIN